MLAIMDEMSRECSGRGMEAGGGSGAAHVLGLTVPTASVRQGPSDLRVQDRGLPGVPRAPADRAETAWLRVVAKQTS